MSRKHPGRPGKESWEKCRFEGCQSDAKGAKGFCHTHYVYSRRGLIDPETGQQLRPFKRVSSYSEGSTCKIDGCAGRPVSRWMCSKHSQQRDSGIIDEQGKRLRDLLPTGRRRERERWVGSTRDGYVLRVAPEGHPFARADGSILEHRLVMEQHVGHPLDPDEFIVHHKDGNRQDNRIENLELLSAQARQGKGHPPGSGLDSLTAIQVLFQDPQCPDELKKWLEWFRQFLQDNKK